MGWMPSVQVLCGKNRRLSSQWSAEDMYSAVFIPKEDVVYKGLRVLDVLTGIPRIDVRRMMERVIELIPKLRTGKQGGSSGLRARNDAFDIAVEDALQTINSRLKAGDFGQ